AYGGEFEWGLAVAGWVGPDCWVVGLGPMDRMVRKFFRLVFRRTFLWTVLPLTSNFRACAVLSWFCLSFNCSFDYISRVVGMIGVSGTMNVRCMSGDWIASVCRLCARAPNYRPTILLSCVTNKLMFVDLFWGLCCVPI